MNDNRTNTSRKTKEVGQQAADKAGQRQKATATAMEPEMETETKIAKY